MKCIFLQPKISSKFQQCIHEYQEQTKKNRNRKPALSSTGLRRRDKFMYIVRLLSLHVYFVFIFRFFFCFRFFFLLLFHFQTNLFQHLRHLKTLFVADMGPMPVDLFNSFDQLRALNLSGNHLGNNSTELLQSVDSLEVSKAINCLLFLYLYSSSIVVFVPFEINQV